MRYKISVIVPIYRAGDYFQAAFDSLLSQTIGFSNLEILLVDDASADGTAAQLEALAASYDNVCVVQLPQNSGGPGLPRNVALSKATAPYIMFLDKDDQFASKACEILYGAIERTGCEIATGDVAYLRQDRKGKWEKEIQLHSGAGSYRFDGHLTEKHRIFAENFCCKIYRRDIIAQNNLQFYEKGAGEDAMFLCRYLMHCSRGEYLNEVVHYYRRQPNSLNEQKTKKYFLVTADSCAETIDYARKIGKLQFMAGLWSCGALADAYVDDLLNTDLQEPDLFDVCEAWQPIFAFYAAHGIPAYSAYTKILVDDLGRQGDAKAAVFHFLTLRDLYRQRKQELDAIFQSRSWKAVQRLNRFLKRS